MKVFSLSAIIRIFFVVVVVFVSYLVYLLIFQVPSNVSFSIKLNSFHIKFLVRTKQWNTLRNMTQGTYPESTEDFDFFLEKIKYKTNPNDHEMEELEMNHYVPKKKYNQKPDIFIHFHGGGFTFAHPNAYFFLHEMMVKRGFIVVSPNYRLCPENSLQDMVEDALKTIEWIKEKYGADRNIIISGDSAGGTIAELTNREMRKKGYELFPKENIITAGFFPWICFRGERDCPVKLIDESDRTLMIDRKSLEAFVSVGKYGKFSDMNLFENTENLPNSIIFVSEFDPLRNEGEHYSKLLQKENKKNKLILMEGESHSFAVKGVESFQNAVEEIIEFYKEVKK